MKGKRKNAKGYNQLISEPQAQLYIFNEERNIEILKQDRNVQEIPQEKRCSAFHMYKYTHINISW